MPDSSLLERIAAAPAIAFAGRLTRCVTHLSFATGNPPRYLFTSGLANRCNPAAVSCLYFAEDQPTAECEYRSYFDDDQPLLIFHARFRAQAILDLGDEACRQQFGVSDEDLFGGFRLRTEPTRLQRLGTELARQSRIAAIRFPSAACQRQGRSGFNFALFPDAIRSPDLLEILGAPGSPPLETWP